MIRRFLLCGVVALLGVGALAPAAGAYDEWCEVDPAVLVRTPGGNTVVVHITSAALGIEHEAALRAASISTTVQAGGAGGTDVEIEVTVPDDALATGFSTRTMASTLPWGTGTVLATETGKSGQAMKLRFRLDIP
jgi:hypothetical protein